MRAGIVVFKKTGCLQNFRCIRFKYCMIFFLSFVLALTSLTFAGPKEDAEEALKKNDGASSHLSSKKIYEPFVDMDIPQLKAGPLSHKEILQLVTESGASVEDVKPDWVDSCGYEPVYRLTRPFGTSPVWDYVPPASDRKLKKCPEFTLDQTYRSRIGGMRRLDLMSEDQVGQMLFENMVHDSDGPGNNDDESDFINKKYGLRRSIYLPTIPSANSDSRRHSGFHTILDNSPFLPEWQEPYLEIYNQELDSLIAEVKQWSKYKSQHTLEDPETLYLLFAYNDMTPIGYFLGAIEKDYGQVALEFKKEFGFDLPLQIPLITPKQYAQKIKFWLWVRQKASNLIKLNAKATRQKITNGLIVGNIHLECEWDYERLAEGYDWVGVSVRPTLLPENDDLGRLYWMGYGARLFGDLTDKPSMISVRSNTLGGGPRVVPSASSLIYWHNQAIQNGCIGFYLWVNEYPAAPGEYRGICYGNPDKSTLPMIRWNTHMRMSKQLAHTKIFNPPKAKTATLVSLTSCAIAESGAWKIVFSSYIELCRAKVWNSFISDQEIWEGSESLEQFKTIYIPSMIFEKEVVVKKLLEYVKNGGTVICGDAQVFSYNLEGEDISHYRRELFGVNDIKTRTLASKQIDLDGDYSGISIKPYSAGYTLEPRESTRLLGKYEDGKVAVTLNRYGKGKALLFGAPILDIYSAGIRSFDSINKREDTSRLDLLKKIEKDSGIEDQSWIWDVTVNNLKNVTGWVP